MSHPCSVSKHPVDQHWMFRRLVQKEPLGRLPEHHLFFFPCAVAAKLPLSLYKAKEQGQQGPPIRGTSSDMRPVDRVCMTLRCDRVGRVRCGRLRCSACCSTCLYHSTNSSGLCSISKRFTTLSLPAQCCISTGSASLSHLLLSVVLSRHVLLNMSNEKVLSAGTEMLARTQEAFSALGPLVMKENLVLAFEVTLS